jgi:hypothetical protein
LKKKVIMLKMKINYRKYREGDALEINKLYYQITGRNRTIEQHAWQWLQSPAGESEMWLIEAEDTNSKKILVGHHGVIAEAFTYYGKKVRVGKTENTMVLPEYRNNFLYPRYEKIFLSQYESKFHALFSTMGPAPAIRVRKAMGYITEHEWLKFYFAREPQLSLELGKNYFFKKRLLIFPSENFIWKSKEGVVTNITNDLDVFDFDYFWEKAAINYGLTPERKRENLNWRFWSNPHITHSTLKIDIEKIGTAIAIVSVRKGRILIIDDIYCYDPLYLSRFIKLLSDFSKDFLNSTTIEIQTTSDCRHYFNNSHAKTTSLLHLFLRNNKNKNKLLMPRKVTTKGEMVGLHNSSNWYITPFFFEGL